MCSYPNERHADASRVKRGVGLPKHELRTISTYLNTLIFYSYEALQATIIAQHLRLRRVVSLRYSSRTKIPKVVVTSYVSMDPYANLEGVPGVRNRCSIEDLLLTTRLESDYTSNKKHLADVLYHA